MDFQNTVGIVHWNGTTQNDRLPKALSPDYIKIDERSTSDILAYAQEYSKLLNFYNIQNEPDGNWYKFLSKDISIFLSSIIATDLRRIDRQHSRILNQLDNAARVEDKVVALEELSTQIMDLAKQINDWYVHALEMNRHNPMDSNELENELENAIKQQLSKHLLTLNGYHRELGFHKIGIYSEEQLEETFHPIWFSTDHLLASRDLAAHDPNAENRIHYYTKKMRLLYRTFYSVTAFVIQLSPRFLHRSLTEKDDHRPDMGMVILFAQLFKHLQDQLNTITQKHLDFYYYDVLQQQQRQHRADIVNVYFELAQHVDTFVLPKNTPLTAGLNEEGEELLYATNYDLALNKAQIASLCTLFVSKNPKIGIGSSYRLITNLYAAPIANSRNGQGERFINNEEDWPTFGEELLEKTEAERQMTYSTIGWAVSAPILEMEEGHRIITLRLEFDKSSMYTLNLLMKDLSKNLKISKEDAFSKVFKDSIEIYFTTAQGWMQANTCEVLPPDDWNKAEITIVATMGISAPPIVGYNSDTMRDKNLGGNFDTTFPVMKIVHRNRDTIYSYSFLKELSLEKVFIDVTAQGLKRLALSSDLGSLDASMPFQPFGPIPRLGSYLLIGKAELFKKDLTDLQFNIEWHNAPDHKRGLKGYYKEYGLGITNDAFKVRITALSEGEFYPTPDSGTVLEYNLFEEDPLRAGALSAQTSMTSMDLSVLNIKPNYQFQLPPAYSNEVRTGYLKMELVSPRMAFAHDDYTSVFTKVVTHNANPNKKGPDLPLPKQPFTPVIRSFTIDYSASTQVNIVSIGAISKGEAAVEEFYHIHPYGIIKTFEKGKALNRKLLPTYEDDAYLFIALRDLDPPTSLSIYFELREQLNLYTMNRWDAKPEITWSYLSNNEWKEFSQNAIMNDTTNGFNNSGIVVMDLPRDLTKGNHILPQPDCFWLRVSLKGDPLRMPRTLKVATQAVSATWQNSGGTDQHLAKPLGSNKITGLFRPMNEIRATFQPYPSFGGRPHEKGKEFYTRVSERLRHKNRAVSAWDFERLILDRFPNIFQAKCIPHLNNEKYVPKGSLTIVVVPRITPDKKGILPVVNPTMLQNIKESLMPYASPFMNIEVRNPVYERVKITCGVRFEKGKNNGTYLKMLNEEIMEYMCPWMSGQEQEVDLGGAFSKDMLLSFIEKRPYVEFVTKFSAVQVYHSSKVGFDVEDTAIDTSKTPALQATTPWSVLIPFETNPIYFIDETSFQAPEKASINSMIIDGDFVMTQEKENDLTTFLEQFDPKKKDK